MNDRDRIERALRLRGPHGITQLDFDAPDVLDGGKPIKRVAARINELRKPIEEGGRGLDIRSGGWRNSVKVYVLHVEDQPIARPPAHAAPPARRAPQRPPAAPAADMDAPALTLLEAAAHRGQRSAIFDFDDEDLGSAA